MQRRTFLASGITTSLAAITAPRALAHAQALTHARLSSQPTPRPEASSTLPASRLPALARGINLSHWMWYPHAQTESARRALITASDLTQLADAGFTHIRLPFEPDWLWSPASSSTNTPTTNTPTTSTPPGSLNEPALREYLDAVRACHASGLAVIIDAHWSRTPWIRPGEPTHAARMGELERMWAALAPRCRDLDPARTLLEIVNEPHDITAAAWAESQSLIARTIRAAAPDHTIIATGASWGSIDGLLELAPLDDPNIIYSFHFYEPHNFTHQGATWGFPPWKDMKNIPWPAARADLEALADTFPAESRNTLRWSARDGTTDPWTPEALDARIERIHQWSLTHSRPIYCGEFGAHKPTAPRASRLAWTHALAESLNTRAIGWAMWDYFGGFALAEGPPGSRTLDADLVKVLMNPGD